MLILLKRIMISEIPARKASRNKSEQIILEDDQEIKLKQAFKVFDPEISKIEKSDAEHVMRAADICPSITEMNEILKQIQVQEEKESNEEILWDDFYPVVKEVMENKRYPLASLEMLKEAFLILDESKKGYLTEEEIRQLMTSGENGLNSNEMEEMLHLGLSKEDGNFHYKDYIYHLLE